MTRVNRIIFNFLWSGKTELVKRGIIFQPRLQGGLGLCNIVLKTQALLLRPIAKIIDDSCETKWVHFGRYWAGRCLSKYSSSWSFLRSNKLPHSISRPPIYDSILSLFDKFYKSIMSPDRDLFSVRRLYDILLRNTVVAPRAQNIWLALSASQLINWSTVWSTAMSGLSTGHENDIAWKITHRVLQTLYYLRSWGIHTDGNCKRCRNVPETIEHAFLHCPIAIETWISFKPLLQKLGSASFDITPETALLRIFPQTVNNRHRTLLTYLIKLVCYNLWIYRCRLVYDKQKVNSRDVIFAIRDEIRDRCLISFNTKHLDGGKSFNSFTVDNILAKVENDSVIFNL